MTNRNLMHEFRVILKEDLSEQLTDQTTLKPPNTVLIHLTGFL